MNKSPNLKLNLVPADENTKYFLDWRNEMSSDDSSSNMMIIDTEIQEIKDKINNKIIYSIEEPTNQINEGDIWNEILQ